MNDKNSGNAKRNRIDKVAYGIPTDAIADIRKHKYDVKAAISRYYDDMFDTVKDMYDPDKKYNYVLSKDPADRNIVAVIDDNNQVIFKGIYQVIGIYNFFNSVWYWGYNVQFVDRALTEGVKVVKQLVPFLFDNYD